MCLLRALKAHISRKIENRKCYPCESSKQTMCCIFTSKTSGEHIWYTPFFPPVINIFGSATVCFQPWARGEDKIEGSLSLTVDYISALIYSGHPLTIRVWTNTNKNNTHGPGSNQTPLCPSLGISAWQSKRAPAGALNHLSYSLLSAGAHLLSYLDIGILPQERRKTFPKTEVQASSGNLEGILAGA